MKGTIIVRDQIFISYSRKDIKWLEELKTTLAPLVRTETIDIWDDTRIQPGQEWRLELESALARAKVAVLLVTKNFLASDFIAKHELPPLLNAAQHEDLTVLWVSVGPCMWKETEIERYQAVNDASRPLSTLRRAARDEVLVQIGEAIKQAATCPAVDLVDHHVEVMHDVKIPSVTDKKVNEPSADPEQANITEKIELYFTNTDELLNYFVARLSPNPLDKRFLFIHGVSGVGKSSLLRMFRLNCKRRTVPVALIDAGGPEVTSPRAVLAQWASQLEADGVELPRIAELRRQFTTIQSRIDQEIASLLHRRSPLTTRKSSIKPSSSTNMARVAPGLASMLHDLGDVEKQTLLESLPAFLSANEVRLLREPDQAWTEAFLTDIAQAAKQRIVLLLDTFEKLLELDKWLCRFAQNLDRNVLLVIAGHNLPDWELDFPDCIADALMKEIKLLEHDDIKDLVRKYYRLNQGHEPDPTQVEKIVHFVDGLPMGATTAVRLWIKYDAKDFETVEQEVITVLVDRLRKSALQELWSAIEVISIVRWFDQPILRAMLRQSNVNDVYTELRQFPFMRPHPHGYMLHDAVRNLVQENIRHTDRVLYRTLHTRAAEYYEAELKVATGSEAEQFSQERLYHRVQADPKTGVDLFQTMAEELARFSLINELRRLLTATHVYLSKVDMGRLWWQYYDARVAHLELRRDDAEASYQQIAHDTKASPKLRAYALCDWGQLLTRYVRLGEPGGIARALQTLEQSRNLVPMDNKLVLVYSHLRNIHEFRGQWEESFDVLEQQRRFLEDLGDTYGVASTLAWFKDTYGTFGDFKRAHASTVQGLELLKQLPHNVFLRIKFTGSSLWYLIWTGQYAQAEQGMQDAVNVYDSLGLEKKVAGAARDLGLVLGLQGRYEAAEEYFQRSEQGYGKDNLYGLAATYGTWGYIKLRQGKLQEAEEQLTKSLTTRRQIHDNGGIPEVANWIGNLYEIMARQDASARDRFLALSVSAYQQSLDLAGKRHNYQLCGTFVGMARVKYLQNDMQGMLAFFTEATQLAQDYDYNDWQSALYLLQGHVAWQGLLPEWGHGATAALPYYREAMIRALTFSPFLLDEVVQEQVTTPLISIISQCQQQGAEGGKMLNALREMWQTETSGGSTWYQTERSIRELTPHSRPEFIAKAIDEALRAMQIK